jgi:uncharacterized membrane protein
MDEAPENLIFEAELRPHRSMSPHGLSIVIGLLCVVSLGVTMLFWSMGAWPIAGFNGVEMLIAAALLHINARAKRAREVLLLSDQGLRVLRFDVNGRRSEREIPSAWLNVTLQERPGRVPALYVTARGRVEEVAQALGEDEKRDLAAALANALHSWRHPVFDNPQLREESA